MIYRYANYTLSLLFLLLSSCFNKSANTDALVRDFIGEQEEKVKLYQTEFNKSYWQFAQQVDNSDSLQNFCRSLHRKQGLYMELQSNIGQLFSDFSDYRFLMGVKQSGLVNDQLLNRQIEELLNRFKASNYGHDSIELKRSELIESFTLLNNHKSLNWRRNDTLFNDFKKQLQLLHYDLNAFLISANKFAVLAGYDNYFDFVMERNEVTKSNSRKVLNQIELSTRLDYRRLKEKAEQLLCDSLNLNSSDLKLKHYYYFMQQYQHPNQWNRERSSIGIKSSCAEVFREYVEGFESYIDKAVVAGCKQGRYKSIILNCDNYYDLRSYCTTPLTDRGMVLYLGDMGRLLAAAEVDSSVPYFLRQHNPIIEEAIASFFTNLSFVSEKVRRKLELGHLEDQLDCGIQNPWLLFKIRYLLVLAEMEQEMFENPDQDLTVLFWSKIEQYLFINIEKQKQNAEWINDPYILALDGSARIDLYSIVLASQFLYASNKFNDFKVSFNDDFLAYGNSIPWDELVKRLTGEGINPEYLKYIYQESV